MRHERKGREEAPALNRWELSGNPSPHIIDVTNLPGDRDSNPKSGHLTAFPRIA